MEVASGEYGEDKVQILVQSVKTGNCDKMVSSLSRNSTPRNSHHSVPSICENDVPLDLANENTELLGENEASNKVNGHLNGFVVGDDSLTEENNKVSKANFSCSKRQKIFVNILFVQKF